VTSNEQQFVFESPVYPGQPLNHHVMSVALRGMQGQDQDGRHLQAARPPAVHTARSEKDSSHAGWDACASRARRSPLLWGTLIHQHRW